jgi:hypothetical protein
MSTSYVCQFVDVLECIVFRTVQWPIFIIFALNVLVDFLDALSSLDVPVDVFFKFCFVFSAPLETDLATKSLQIQSKRYQIQYNLYFFSLLSRKKRGLTNLLMLPS